MEKVIKEISEAGTKVIVSGGNVGELALHYIEKYKMMVLKTSSKWDLRRICRATGSVPLVRLGAPTPEELGFCDVVSIDEIGSTKVCVFRQDSEGSRVSTVIVRASTKNRLDDIERAIDDGVSVFKSLTKNQNFVSGAGSSEIEVARLLLKHGESCPGLEQYAIKAYAESFEVIPRTLAENSGFKEEEIIGALYAAHENGKASDGLDLLTGSVKNAKEMGVLDHYETKSNALKLATQAAVTILRVDQIIMAKAAGGPQAPPQGPRDF
eukprot:TRINITY_DN3431_c0_g1_i2.p3 TRINITY_DN3431_c0_g1~~TRINITY_DN3431_c0_g1_i2.p3  ORF type:complete len:267 (+),score=58.01 TRINITY_DN3431_c0_g1_i2:859-1659(+)